MKTVAIEEWKDAEKVSRLCHEDYLPVMLTKDGKADMVIMSAYTYRELLDNMGDADEWYDLPDIEITPNNPLGDDVLIKSIMHFAIKTGTISTCAVQRKFCLGYTHASEIMDFLQEHKFVSPPNGVRPRNVLVTEEEFLREFARIEKEGK